MESGQSQDVLAAMTVNFREWLRPRLKDGRYFGVFLEEAGDVVAGAGMILLDWQPNYLHPESNQRGYILNVFVEPTHRGGGLRRN